MAYYLDLFSPATFEAFGSSDRTVTGFRPRQRAQAERVEIGDKFICYMTKLGRWCGLLEVTGGWFSDSTPRFYADEDPFTVRFKVEPEVWLPKEKAIPIRDDRIWEKLSFTHGQDKATSRWTGRLRSSLARIEESDGLLLEQWLRKQFENGEVFPVDERQYSSFLVHQVRSSTGIVNVSVPDKDEEEVVPTPEVQGETRESIKVQAGLARIGAEMGMKIWIPKNDRGGVLREWTDTEGSLLDVLPLNYDTTTIKTIEQIDVIWLKGRSIVRAFEVEHTTSIYSGLLRMADLLALQPNLNIRLHIVAPAARREKVKDEIRRPVFALLDKGPLADSCTYLSYESVEELARERHLAYLSDSVLEEFAEEAD